MKDNFLFIFPYLFDLYYKIQNVHVKNYWRFFRFTIAITSRGLDY